MIDEGVSQGVRARDPPPPRGQHVTVRMSPETQPVYTPVPASGVKNFHKLSSVAPLKHVVHYTSKFTTAENP